MNISKTQVSRVLVVLIFLANIMFFSLPGIASALSSICGFTNKRLVVFLIIVLLLFYFGTKYPLSIFKGASSRIAIYYICMCLITFIISCFSYNGVGIKTFVSNYYYFAAILLYFPLKHMLKNQDDYRWLVHTIILIGTIYAIYMIGAKLIYSYSGRIIFDQTAQYVQQRNGSLRLARPASFVCISTIFSFTEWLKYSITGNKTSKKYFLLFCIGMFCLVWVTQTRIYQLAFLISCSVTLATVFNNKKKIILFFALLFFIPIIIGEIREFYLSFYSVENIWGTEIRVSGYTYFLSHMFDNYICGIGLVSGTPQALLLTGGKTQYGYVITDMGYTGFLGVYGILGVALLILLGRLFLKTKVKIEQKNLLLTYPEVISLPILFVIMTWSLSFTDPQRCLYLPIILAVYSFYESQSINQLTENGDYYECINYKCALG